MHRHKKHANHVIGIRSSNLLKSFELCILFRITCATKSQSPYSFSVCCFSSSSFVFCVFVVVDELKMAFFMCVCVHRRIFLISFLTYFIFTYKFHLANTQWTRKSVTDFALSNEVHVINVIIFIDIHSLKQKSFVLFRRQENEKYGEQRVREEAQIKKWDYLHMLKSDSYIQCANRACKRLNLNIIKWSNIPIFHFAFAKSDKKNRTHRTSAKCECINCHVFLHSHTHTKSESVSR